MILVLNCGSQSIKWVLYDSKKKKVKAGEKSVADTKKYKSFLTEELSKLENYKNDIEKIGHRFVHGGKKFRKPLELDSQRIKELEKLNYLAPLHNPYNLLGIKIGREKFPKAEQIAVFDTGFYINLPEVSRTYPLPEHLRKKYNIQKFGFHGISHEYASKEAAKQEKKPFGKIKIITCHLGGGSSVTAVNKGKVIDTSMGFTPLGGVAMMTRPGDIDPGVVLEIGKNIGLAGAEKALNSQSGLKGICKKENMLKILESIKQGDRKAKMALDIFAYSIQKYIGSYYALMGGCDLLVFTGKIGWGSAKIRKMISNIKILNKTKVIRIKPDEERAILQKIYG